MYEELVNALRETDFSDGCPCVSSEMCKNKDCIILQAVDAIEELQKRVPKRPHGRLIDADELHSALRKRAKEFSNSEYGEGVKCGLADAREYIKIATTIVPAEEEE